MDGDKEFIKVEEGEKLSISWEESLWGLWIEKRKEI